VQDNFPAFDNDFNFDTDNIEIGGDHVFMIMVYPVDPQYFIHASSMVSRHLAEDFAKNPKPKGFHEMVHIAPHSYGEVFGETAFDTL
jgi:hypothetical protein